MKRLSWRHLGILVLAAFLFEGGAAIFILSLPRQVHAENVVPNVNVVVAVNAVRQVEYELLNLKGIFARHVAGDPQVTMETVQDQMTLSLSMVNLIGRIPLYTEVRPLTDLDRIEFGILNALADVDTALASRGDFREDASMLRQIEVLLAKPATMLAHLKTHLMSQGV